MSEHIISDEVLQSIQRTCYEAGKAGREVYTVRGADGSEIIRCRDCKKLGCPLFIAHGQDPNGFCAWAERREA